MKRSVRVIVVAILVTLGVLALAASRGSFETQSVKELLTDRAAAWTAPCLTRRIKARWSQCARVNGSVVWVQRRDPDGDGDRHLLVIENFHARILKLPEKLGVHRLPRVGQQVEAVGPVVIGSSGRHEIHTKRFRLR